MQSRAATAPTANKREERRVQMLSKQRQRLEEEVRVLESEIMALVCFCAKATLRHLLFPIAEQKAVALTIPVSLRPSLSRDFRWIIKLICGGPPQQMAHTGNPINFRREALRVVI